MELWMTAVSAFWFIAPAYAANAFPPLVNGKTPLDFGKEFYGNRLLGDGKTFEGSIAGIIFGIVIGSMLISFQSQLQSLAIESGFTLPTLSIYLIILLSIGAIIGDMIGAFIKRRFGIARGEPAPLLDQLDFLAGALLFSSIIYVPPLFIIIFLIIITPIIHYLGNLFAYVIKVKKTWW